MVDSFLISSMCESGNKSTTKQSAGETQWVRQHLEGNGQLISTAGIYDVYNLIKTNTWN